MGVIGLKIINTAFELCKLIDHGYPNWKDRYCARLMVMKILNKQEAHMEDWKAAFDQLKEAEG